MKWAGTERYARLGSEAQALQTAFTNLERIKAFEQTKKSATACPPASCVQRHIGGKAWHGNAYYDQVYANALSLQQAKQAANRRKAW